MSNNQGDKPEITQGEYIAMETPFFSIKNDHRVKVYIPNSQHYFICFGADLRVVLNNAKMIATAGNLSQKYGSLEGMESELIGLKEQHHNDILLAQAASEKISELEAWKESASGVILKWGLVDDFVRNHPDTKIADYVSTKALELLKRGVEAETRVKELEELLTEKYWLETKEMNKLEIITKLANSGIYQLRSGESVGNALDYVEGSRTERVGYKIKSDTGRLLDKNEIIAESNKEAFSKSIGERPIFINDDTCAEDLTEEELKLYEDFREDKTKVGVLLPCEYCGTLMRADFEGQYKIFNCDGCHKYAVWDNCM